MYQECQDEQLNSEFSKFHEHLVNEIVQFCRKYNIKDIDEFQLSGDHLYESIKFGTWHASTDSSFSLKRKDNNISFIYHT